MALETDEDMKATRSECKKTYVFLVFTNIYNTYNTLIRHILYVDLHEYIQCEYMILWIYYPYLN